MAITEYRMSAAADIKHNRFVLLTADNVLIARLNLSDDLRITDLHLADDLLVTRLPLASDLFLNDTTQVHSDWLVIAMTTNGRHDNRPLS